MKNLVREAFNQQSTIKNHNKNCSVILIILYAMPDFSIGVDLGGTISRIAAVSVTAAFGKSHAGHQRLPLGRDHVIAESVRLFSACRFSIAPKAYFSEPASASLDY